MLAALIIQANKPPAPPIIVTNYLQGGGVDEEEEKQEYLGYFDPPEQNAIVAWELGFDYFEKGKVSFEKFALRASLIAGEEKKKTPMQLALEEIRARREVRKKLIRNGVIVAVGSYALWRLFLFL